MAFQYFYSLYTVAMKLLDIIQSLCKAECLFEGQDKSLRDSNEAKVCYKV